MNKLICLLGKSGSGKSTIEKALTGKNYNFSKIVSVTTRKKRDSEVDGYDYYFVSEKEYSTMYNDGKFFETAKYGGNMYGILNGEIHGKLESSNCVAVVEPHGYSELLEKLDKDIVVGIYVNTNDCERLSATIKRNGRMSSTEQLLSICNRFISDDIKYNNTINETHYNIFNDYNDINSIQNVCLEINKFIGN